MAYKNFETGIRNLLATVASPYREAMAEWNEEMKAQDYADQSRLRKLSAPRDFAGFLAKRGKKGKPFEKATRKDVRDWLNGLDKRRAERLAKRGKKAKRVLKDRPKVDLRAFYRWIAQDRQDPALTDCVEWLAFKPRNANALPVEAILSPEEIRGMVEAADSPRDKALIITLYESALTHTEFLSLSVGAVGFDKLGAFVILPEGVREHGGRRIRLIGATPYLRTWVENHPNGHDPEAPLWVSFDASLKAGESRPRLASSSLNAVVKRLAKRAGIAKRVWPHLFRHSRLTELAMRGAREHDLKEIAGWSAGSRMASKYIHLSGVDTDKKILEIYGMAEPEKGLPDALAPQKCPRCAFENEADAGYCKKCSQALSVEWAREAEAEEEERKHLDRLVRQTLLALVEGKKPWLTPDVKEKLKLAVERDYLEEKGDCGGRPYLTRIRKL